MRKIILFAGLLAVPLMGAPAEAQQTVQVCVHSTTTSSCAPVNSSNGFPVNVVAGASGGGAVYGPTVAGSAAANPPVLMGGTRDGTSTGTVQNAEVDSNADMHVLEHNSAALLTAVQAPIPAGTNAIGTLTGSTAYGLQSAASTNSTNVKNAAGVVKAMNLINTTTTIYYLRMYNLATAPTCSSATGFVRTWPIPPAASSGGAGGLAVNLGAGGTTFSTGIGFCLTGGPTSTDNTNAATGVFINLDYQ